MGATRTAYGIGKIEMTQQSAVAEVVVVPGGDAIVDRTLWLLLQGTDYTVSFPAELAGPLDKIRLILLAPGVDAEHREAILALVRSTPAVARIPILELSADTDRVIDEPGYLVVPWPLRAEELRQRIKEAVLAGPRPCDSLPENPGAG